MEIDEDWETNRTRRILSEKILSGKIIIESGNRRTLKYGEIFDDPCNMYDLIVNLDGQANYLSSGSYGSVMEICLDPKCKYRFALKNIKMIPNESYGIYKNPYRPENVEVEILKLLNVMLYAGASPHIPYYMGDFICKDIIKKYRYRYIMSEMADGNLSNYIDSEKKTGVDRELIWKVFFFQILSTLATIQLIYPNFRHNDLHPMNILYFKRRPGGYYKYHVGGVEYFVPNTGFQLAIWDFDFASISGLIDNVKVFGYLNQGIYPGKNFYHDMHKLFNSMLTVYGSDFGTYKFPEKALKFLKYVVPEKLRGKDKPNVLKNYSLLYNYEYMTPLDALRHPYFDEFWRNIPKGQLIESYRDTNVLSYNINIKTPVNTSFIFTCKDMKKQGIFIPKKDNIPSSINSKHILMNFISKRENCHLAPDKEESQSLEEEEEEEEEEDVAEEEEEEEEEDEKENEEDTIIVFSRYRKNISVNIKYAIDQIYPDILKENSTSEIAEKYNENKHEIAKKSYVIVKSFIDRYKFPQSLLVPLIMGAVLKATFYITHYYVLNTELFMEVLSELNIESNVLTDFLVQFQTFLIESGIESIYQSRYKLT